MAVHVFLKTRRDMSGELKCDQADVTGCCSPPPHGSITHVGPWGSKMNETFFKIKATQWCCSNGINIFREPTCSKFEWLQLSVYRIKSQREDTALRAACVRDCEREHVSIQAALGQSVCYLQIMDKIWSGSITREASLSMTMAFGSSRLLYSLSKINSFCRL